jgi:subtilisin family serine protease
MKSPDRAPVRVAVIDSGVHPTHPHIHGDLLEEGVAVGRDGMVTVGAGATIDLLGHGTAVTAAIQEKAPEARCIPVRVFHDGLRASATALSAAVRWSIAARVDAINLSLGTVNPAHEAVLQAVADEAFAAGIALIAAREAGGQRCYPGSLQRAIGVGLDWNCSREGCHVLNDDFYASGQPRPIPGVEPRRNLYGISFAVANLTGLAARALPTIGGDGPNRIAALREKLAREAIVNVPAAQERTTVPAVSP